jgi:hypothetical protein
MDYKKFRLFICFFFIVSKCYSSEFSFGECKNYNFYFDLDLRLFMGSWYPIVTNTKKKIDCFKLHLKMTDSNQVQAYVNDTRMRTSGYSAQLFPSKSKNTFIVNTGFLKGIVTILDTDYDSYAIILSCSEFLMTKKHYVAILSRKDKLSPELILKLKAFIEAKVGIKKFRDVKQGETCGLV